jgi:membrane-associated phospholipid phosphatase
VASLKTGSGKKIGFLSYLAPADIVILVFLTILTGIFIWYNTAIEYWFLNLSLNLILIFGIGFIVTKYEKKISLNRLDESKFTSVLKILRYWYGVGAILIIFKQVYIIIYSLKPADWDPLFIQLDFFLFGVNPTQWAYQFEHPVLTEFLQIVYIYYYPMIAVIGLQLYLRHRYKEFKFTIFILFFSFCLSYLLYFFFPANGPRFHLHEFSTINIELPGLILTDYIRAFINMGESIPPGVPNPQDYVQRDAMPSLHTISAFLIMYLSWKFHMKSFRYFYLPYFICMVVATVYLRYHYVVDIIGGLVVCAITIAIGKALYKDTFST